jgi:hypothetical protein
VTRFARRSLAIMALIAFMYLCYRYLVIAVILLVIVNGLLIDHNYRKWSLIRHYLARLENGVVKESSPLMNLLSVCRDHVARISG